jgi:hypothetical protein
LAALWALAESVLAAHLQNRLRAQHRQEAPRWLLLPTDVGLRPMMTTMLSMMMII